MWEVQDIVGVADVWRKHMFATLEDAGGERNDGRTAWEKPLHIRRINRSHDFQERER